MYEYNRKNIQYLLQYAILNLSHANKALTELPELIVWGP